MPEEIAQEVRAAREQPALRAKGKFQDISAEDYGRLSGRGDRGTSVFNYLTNFILLTVAVEQIVGKTFSMDHHIASIISGSAGFEFMFEGDDWSLVLSLLLYHSVLGWGARLGAFYREITSSGNPLRRRDSLPPWSTLSGPSLRAGSSSLRCGCPSSMVMAESIWSPTLC